MAVGRPKTTRLLQAEAIGYGTEAIATLVKYIKRDDGGDPRMAAVIVKAAEILLDKCGLSAANAAALAAKEPNGPGRQLPASAQTIETLEAIARNGGGH